ncbi:hypothetical protein K490DRAFT_67870 [Saccharata proteae CBS 121410]|uniref:Mediator of RNA polymerase II transcription subunit 22 n=1 Tax=Saccharata proteae CBS 121410 TaxID=1314787 RepID=A0A9P4HSJ5_9PEZI|nr:hypothetical protein K490DRAFT_67870 [Saccharata proteae CBS 121410]
MATVQKSPSVLLEERMNKRVGMLVQRFENLIALVAPNSTDLRSTANMQFQMAVESAALIKGAEDTLTLIREMQEMLLFGQLDTLERSGMTQMTDDVEAVAVLIEELVGEKY